MQDGGAILATTTSRYKSCFDGISVESFKRDDSIKNLMFTVNLRYKNLASGPLSLCQGLS